MGVGQQRPGAGLSARRHRAPGARSSAIAQRVAHRSTSACNPSSPRRSRELTVPRGSPSAEAISPGVKPSRWRMTITARWSGGSAASAARTSSPGASATVDHRRLDPGVGHLAPQLAGAGVVDGAVDDDPMQPGAEGPAAVEAIQRADGGEEGLLRDVLGGGRVVHHEPRRPVGARPMAAEELGEGLARAALRGPDERRLGRARPRPARGAGAQRLQGDRLHARDRRTHHAPVTSGMPQEVPAIIRAVQPEFLPPDPHAPAPPRSAAGVAPGLPAAQRGAAGARAGPEQPRRRLADLRLGKPRPALLQRRRAVLPHRSGLDRRLGPRQPRQARRTPRAIRPTSR